MQKINWNSSDMVVLKMISGYFDRRMGENIKKIGEW